MKERYIERVLRALPRARRAGVRRDLEEIFADSQARGESEAQVLERLGPPEAFARGVAPGARRGAGAVWFFVCAAAAVLALGAGAVTKWLFARERRIERAPNLRNIEEYIARVAEMVERKRALIGGDGK